MLRIDALSVGFLRYHGMFGQQIVPQLADISMTLGAGEVVAVIGASGAGKSLLAHAILGLLPPNAVVSGQVEIHGRPLVRGRDVTLMPQQISFLDPLARVGQQVTWAARRRGGQRDACAVLQAVGLGTEVARFYPHQLSGGMARRVLLAMAMNGAADAVLADEPTAGLDPENREMLLGQLRAAADQGRAIMLITHDLMAALPIADRVILLDAGRICAVEPVHAFSGRGEALGPAARAQWLALPQNGFGHA